MSAAGCHCFDLDILSSEKLEKRFKDFHCFRKHLFVLYHAKFNGNNSKKNIVTSNFKCIPDLIFNEYTVGSCEILQYRDYVRYCRIFGHMVLFLG